MSNRFQRSFRAVLARFRRSEQASIAIYFALSAVVFIGVTGLAVDAARGYLIKARLSAAVDAAALAGGKALTNSETKAKADALAFFQANFPAGAMGATVSTPTIVLANNDTTVTVNATASVPTTLMTVLGYNVMNVAATATASRAISGLDVVFSLDVSGSMGSPATKLSSLKSAATALVQDLYAPFDSGSQSQFVTVNGVQYSLLNIGVVPWNSKVNVKSQSAIDAKTSTVVTTNNVASFTNPVTGASQSAYYTTNVSEVPLLSNPSSIAGGWAGCVYARYIDDGDQTNDADLSLGTTVTVGSKTWGAGTVPLWDPVPISQGEDDSCYESSWNNNQNWTSGRTTVAKPSWWKVASPKNSGSCSECPDVGILPLQTDESKVTTMINSLVAGGNTNAPQGLFWAWEVLMPGDPFSEAVVSTPFERAQAIIFMTDGQSYGGNGDSYRGVFGAGEQAATNSSHGTMTVGSSTGNNNYNNRLLALASTIKGSDPTASGAVRIYVIQYEEDNATLTSLLQSVATEPQAPYYYYAPDPSALADIFDEISASLSSLRLVQ
jgi:Flp pilus assembly protein TadG